MLRKESSMVQDLRASLGSDVGSPHLKAASGFRSAAAATLLVTDSNQMTPRRYIKTIHAVVISLAKHTQLFSAAVQSSLQTLQVALEEAAHTHSRSAEGKVHHYLREDLVVARLQAAAMTAADNLSAAGKASAYVDPSFKVAVNEAKDKLMRCRCVLPEHQIHLVNQFRALHKNLDPAEVLSDSVQKQAEQVLLEVVKEVYGPFFNEEVLNKEISHLERVAQHTDPHQQQLEASCIKLLAASLMLLDADDSENLDMEGPIASDDPFALPALPEGRGLNAGEGGSRLVVTISGGDGTAKAVPLSILTSPLFSAASSLTTPQNPSEAGSTDSPLWRQAEEQEHLRQQLNSLSSPASLWSQKQPQQQQQQEAKSPTPSRLRPAEEGFSKSSSRAVDSPERGSKCVTGNSSISSSSISSSSRGDRATQQGAAAADSALQEPQTLDEFLQQSSMPNNRRACSFQAQMQLPDGDLEKLTSFVHSTGRVRGLSLAQNNISDAAVRALVRAIQAGKSVRTLDVRRNCIGDEGAAVLAELLQSNHKLQALQLAHNNVRDKGAQALAKALETNKTLEKLSLHGNQIGSVGCQALISALAANKTLTSLEFLPGNAASPRDIKMLAQALKNNRKLSLANMFVSQPNTT